MTIPSEIKSAFRAREINANKYSVGTVAIVGGSAHYSHAPVMAGLGARASGAGLIRLVVPDTSRACAGAILPEASFTKLSSTCIPPKADVMVIGMGLEVNVNTQLLLSRLLSGSCGRFVLDADALQILADWYSKASGYSPIAGQEIVLTPHEGEAARLLGVSREEILKDRFAAAKAIVERYGATVVLKGERSLVVSSDGLRVYENTAGNPFMALGGMGDLLAGAIGARWAYLKGDSFLATASAVWLHSQASDNIIAKEEDPSILNTASEIGRLRVKLDR